VFGVIVGLVAVLAMLLDPRYDITLHCSRSISVCSRADQGRRRPAKRHLAFGHPDRLVALGMLMRVVVRKNE